MVRSYALGLWRHFGLTYHQAWQLPADVFFDFCDYIDAAKAAEDAANRRG
ncbi:hypothetical protein ABZ468_25960 [Streptomyces sp. NPDC005708]